MARPHLYQYHKYAIPFFRPKFLQFAVGGFVFVSVFLLQLAFGADVKILLLATGTAILALLLLHSAGIFNMASLTGFAFFLNTVIFAVLLKTVLAQPIDENLYSPFTSFFIVFLVGIEIFLAFKLAQIMPVGKSIFQPMNDLRFLKYLAIVCYVSGLFLWLLSQFYHIDPRHQYVSEGEGFGGFTTVYPIFYMSIVASTAFVLISSNNKKSVNKWLVFILLTGTLMGLVESRKMLLGLTFGYYFFTSFVYRYRITARQVIFGVLLLLFIFFIFAPIVHVYRTDLWFLPFQQRIDYIVSNAPNMIQSNYLFNYFRRVMNHEYSLNRYHYFDQNLVLIDRFATIQHSDLVIDSFQNRDVMGTEILWRGFGLILPSFLNPNKSSISLGDEIMWELGLRKYGTVGFATVPLIGSSFAAMNWVGVIIVPFVVFLLLFLAVKKIAPDIRHNIFAIYFIDRKSVV